MSGTGHLAVADGGCFAVSAGSACAGARVTALLATATLHVALVASLVLLTGVGKGGGGVPSRSLTVMALPPPPSPAEPPSRSAAPRPGNARVKAPSARPVDPIKGKSETPPSAGPAAPATKAEIATEPPPPAAVARPLEGQESELREYQAIVWRHIATHKPRGVQIKGTASVRFHLDREGKVLAADVIRSSGNLNLDRIALRAIRQSGAFPQPPAAIASAQLYFVVPIDFR